MRIQFFSTLIRLLVGRPGTKSVPQKQPIPNYSISESCDRALARMTLARLIAFADVTKQRVKKGTAHANLWVRAEYWLDKRLNELPVEPFLTMIEFDGMNNSDQSPPNSSCI